MGRDAVGTVMNDSAGQWVGRVISSIPSTYTIFYDNVDSVYRAENNVRSGTDYNNATFATLMNNNILTDTGKYCLQKGTYTVTATLAPTSGNITLQGAGRENTILKLGANCNLFSLANNVDNITIRDLSFDGTKATYNSNVWSGITGGTSDSILIENCDFYNFKGKGVFTSTWTNFHFRNCCFYNNDQDGLYLEGTAGSPTARGQVTDCVSYSNGRKGFNNGVVKDVKYANCIAYSNAQDGWNIEGSSDGSYQLENVKLIGCTAYSNSNYGFRVQMQAYNVSLTDCDGYSNVGGVYIRGNDAYPMKNIKILGGSYYLNTKNGISVAYGINHLKIIGVSVYNNDQGDTNNDGISFGYTTNFEHFILADIYAYDDQATPTQDRGVDFGTGDESAKDIVCMNIYGEGNTSALFRGTVTTKFNIQGTADKIDLNNGLLIDPQNSVDGTLSGAPKVVEIEIGGATYYFKVYPTKT